MRINSSDHNATKSKPHVARGRGFALCAMADRRKSWRKKRQLVSTLVRPQPALRVLKVAPLYLLAGTLAQAEALAALVNERGIKRVVLVR